MQFNLMASCRDCEEIMAKIDEFSKEFLESSAKILNVDISTMTLGQVTQLLNDNLDKLDRDDHGIGMVLLEKHWDLYNSILAHSHTDDGEKITRH